MEISANDLGLESSEEHVDESMDESEAVVEDVEVQSEEPAEEVVEAQEETVEAVSEEKRPAPQSWKPDYHKVWEDLTPEAKEIIETRERQMHEGLEQYRENSGFGKRMREAIAPFESRLQALNMEPTRAVQALMNAHFTLANGTPEQKRALYETLGRDYGITKAEEQNIDPTIKSLQDQVASLSQTMTAAQQQQFEESRKQAVAQVEKFAADKPYFDEVADDIVPFIENGLSLEEAYDKAVWANPVTRQKELARTQQESEQARLEKAKAEAEAAKKAKGVNIRGRNTNRTPTEPLGTMEDTMKATLKSIRERVH